MRFVGLFAEHRRLGHFILLPLDPIIRGVIEVKELRLLAMRAAIVAVVVLASRELRFDHCRLFEAIGALI